MSIKARATRFNTKGREESEGCAGHDGYAGSKHTQNDEWANRDLLASHAPCDYDALEIDPNSE